jgi:hypothetical protein
MILKIPGQAGAYGSGNNIPVGATIFSSVKVTRYLAAIVATARSGWSRLRTCRRCVTNIKGMREPAA